MAHSTHSHNNWRQKERERVRGRRFSFCPSPPSFTPPRTLSPSLSLTYSLNIHPISDFNQVFSHHDNPGSPRPQSGSPQWDVSLLSPLFARSLPVPSAALFFPEQLFFSRRPPHTFVPVRPALSCPSDVSLSCPSGDSLAAKSRLSGR